VFRKTHLLLGLFAGLGLAPAACKKAAPAAAHDAGVADAGMSMMGDAGTADDIPASGKATVRFKRSERLRNDFAQTLSLDPAKVCNEFGQYSCTDTVHTIALGGVEPYILGVNQPLADTTITTPIAVERVAFAGCAQRVDQDLAANATPVIFKDLGLDSNGAITDVEAPGVAQSIATLYHRALLRDPLPSEVAHLKDMYKDVLATNEAAPGRDWAVLACFSVMTSMEALFY
jgi:hypothetical protein